MSAATKLAEPRERFMSKVSPEPNTGCWLWTGALTGLAYGSFSIGGKDVRAHRYSWELVHGPIPAGLCACHRCDTPICVNPDHLFLGTHAENDADRHAKGRDACGDRSSSRLHPEARPRGEKSSAAKLTEAQVKEIRRLRRDTPISQRAVAALFGLTHSSVAKIESRRSWRHV